METMTMLIAMSALVSGIAGGHAWAAGGDTWASGAYSANVAPFAPGCPAVQWHFVHPSLTDIAGTAFYSDMSGISTFKGTLDVYSGKLHGTLTSVSGHGPEGVVDGAHHGDDSMD